MPAVIQHNSAVQQYTSGTTGTITPSFTNPVTAGSCLAACVSFSISVGSATSAVNSVTTNGAAENWAQAAADASTEVFIWTGPATAGGQQAIPVSVTFGQTASASNSVAVIADIFEIPGVVASGPVDRTSTDTSAASISTSWTSAATAATRTPSQVWLACAWIGNFALANTTETITPPGSPWTTTSVQQTSVQSGGTGTANRFFAYQVCGYQVVSATGTATFAGTSADSSLWSAAVVTLKGGPGLPRPVLLSQAVKTAATW